MENGFIHFKLCNLGFMFDSFSLSLCTELTVGADKSQT